MSEHIAYHSNPNIHRSFIRREDKRRTAMEIHRAIVARQALLLAEAERLFEEDQEQAEEFQPQYPNSTEDSGPKPGGWLEQVLGPEKAKVF